MDEKIELFGTTDIAFKDYLLKDKGNRILLIGSLGTAIILFTCFRYFYPFASYIHGDSFAYVETAYHNFSINTYMVGYSNFIRLVSIFSRSELVLVALQYFLVIFCLLYFLFTLFYHFSSSKKTKIILITFIIINPFILYLSNLISSDCLFLSLSLIWFSQLIWIANGKTNFILLLVHVLVLAFAFTVRYNALIYPFISVFVLIIFPNNLYKKLGAISSIIVLCSSFVLFTSFKYKKLTGHFQYSPFSGWQWANNAMYAYRYVNKTERKPVPARLQALDKAIRNYFDSTRNTKRYPAEKVKASTIYMWDYRISPLYKFRDSIFSKDTSATELKKWSSMGPLFTDYGTHIIKKYPVHYLKYFLLPNAFKYFTPPLEFLALYNSGKDSVDEMTKVWFDYPTQKVTTRIVGKKNTIRMYYPMLAGSMNVLFACSFFCLLLLKEYTKIRAYRNILFLVGLIWLLNAAFTIFASPAAIRFQSFPIIIVSSFSFLYLSQLLKMAFSNTQKSNQLFTVQTEVQFG
jgi:hypothetical protein